MQCKQWPKNCVVRVLLYVGCSAFSVLKSSHFMYRNIYNAMQVLVQIWRNVPTVLNTLNYMYWSKQCE